MLLKFTIKNYKSFKEETVFDFTKSQIEAYSIGMVYGDVCYGKSNFIDAYRFVVNCVTNQYQKLPSIAGYMDSESPRNKPFFENGEFAYDGISTFTVLFKMSPATMLYNPFDDKIDGRVYEYSFSVTPTSILSESLYYYTIDDTQKILKKNRTLVFDREYGAKIKFNKELIEKEHREMFEMCRGDVVKSEDARKHDGSFILHDGAHMKCKILEYVYRFFFNSEICTFSDENVHNALATIVPEYLIDYGEKCKVYAEQLRKFVGDSSISDISVYKNSDTSVLSIYITHTYKNGHVSAFPINEESDGIQKTLVLIHAMNHAREHGGVMVIDDIDRNIDGHVVMMTCLQAYDEIVNEMGMQVIGTTSSIHIAYENTMDMHAIYGACIELYKDENGVSNISTNPQFSFYTHDSNIKV